VWLFPFYSKDKHLVYLFQYIAGLLTYLTSIKKSENILQKTIFNKRAQRALGRSPEEKVKSFILKPIY